MAKRVIFNGNKGNIHLKNGETIRRIVYKNSQGYCYVRYNGHYLWVKNWCGEWFQE